MIRVDSITVQTEPTIEPVTLNEVRTHCRIDTHEENTYLTTLLKTARRYVERTTGRALLTQTLDLKLDAFPARIRLPNPPAASVTSITYTDPAGDSQTLGTGVYELDTARGQVRLQYDQVWPATRRHEDVITVRYVAGWTTRAAVPAELRLAVLQLCQHWYEFREPVLAGTIQSMTDLTVESLLAQWNVWSNV